MRATFGELQRLIGTLQSYSNYAAANWRVPVRSSASCVRTARRSSGESTINGWARGRSAMLRALSRHGGRNRPLYAFRAQRGTAEISAQSPSEGERCLPKELSIFLLCHAVSSNPLFEHRREESSLWLADEAGSAIDIQLTGHTKLPFRRSVGTWPW